MFGSSESVSGCHAGTTLRDDMERHNASIHRGTVVGYRTLRYHVKQLVMLLHVQISHVIIS
jgi:hypothetical protein